MNRENDFELEEGIVPQDFADAYEKERALLLELEFEQELEKAKMPVRRETPERKKLKKSPRILVTLVVS